MAHGHFFWNELNTRDAESAKRFYAETIGWTYNPMPMPPGPDYWVIMDGEQAVGGIFTMAGPGFDGMPEHWFAYIEVDDVDRRVAAAASAGGRVIRPPWDIPGVGRIAVVADAGGAVSGWITPATRPM